MREGAARRPWVPKARGRENLGAGADLPGLLFIPGRSGLNQTRDRLVWGESCLQARQQYSVRQHTALTEIKFLVDVLNQDFSNKQKGNISLFW